MPLIYSPTSRPSRLRGWARTPSQSAYPTLWSGLARYYPTSVAFQGETLRDVSGHRKHGLPTNMAAATAWVPGPRRLGGLAFSIVRGEYVDIPDITVTAEVGNSWGFWFKLNVVDMHFVLSRIGHLNSFVSVFSPSLIVWGELQGTFYLFSSSFNTIDNEWHFLAGTQDVRRTRAYLDGDELSSVNGTYVPGGFPTTAGGSSRWEIIGEDMIGQIAEVVIWNRTLTPGEVRLLFERPSAMLAPERVGGVLPLRVAGPYRRAAGQVWQTGAAAGRPYLTGAEAGCIYVAGQQAGKTHG